MSHTIAAVSTGNQISAIGILRLTGDNCIDISDKVFTLNNQKSLNQMPDRKLVLGSLRDQSGRIIDQCMAVVSRGPHSYTGEDTVEFHCHGSPAVLAAGLDALFAAGARPVMKAIMDEIEKRNVSSGASVESIIIENDFQDTYHESIVPIDYTKVAPDDIPGIIAKYRELG